MIVARFLFREEFSDYFCPGSSQRTVEMTFPDVLDLVDTVKSMERAIENCTVAINGRVVDLAECSRSDAPPQARKGSIFSWKQLCLSGPWAMLQAVRQGCAALAKLFTGLARQATKLEQDRASLRS